VEFGDADPPAGDEKMLLLDDVEIGIALRPAVQFAVCRFCTACGQLENSSPAVSPSNSGT
jgi:hypothetical protein